MCGHDISVMTGSDTAWSAMVRFLTTPPTAAEEFFQRVAATRDSAKYPKIWRFEGNYGVTTAVL